MNKNGSRTLDARVDQLKDSVRNLVDASNERAEQIKEKLIDAKDVAVDRGSAALNRFGVMIKEHPIAALGIAFGLGYLAVRMLRK